MREMIAYKGFGFNNGILTCRDFVYEEGKTYYSPRAVLCVEGFHACKFPLDVFNYYNPIKTSDVALPSRYHKVLLEDVSEEGGYDSYDSKVVAKKITILEEISVGEMIEISKSFFPDPDCLSKNKPNSPDRTFDLFAYSSFDSGFLIQDDVAKTIPVYEEMYMLDYSKNGSRGISYIPFDESKGSFLKKIHFLSADEITQRYSLWRSVPSQSALDEYNERIRHVRKS